jgi:hypothetical protein
MSIHNLGGGFIPYDTEAIANTTATAFQTLLNLTAGYGAALVQMWCDAVNDKVRIKTTVNGSVVMSDSLNWVGYGRNMGLIYYFVWSTSFKIEYRSPAGVTVYCGAAYKNYT